MTHRCERILLACVLTAARQHFCLSSFGQGCKFQAATPDKPASCTAQSPSGTCSPDARSGSTGTCAILRGATCGCVPRPSQSPGSSPALITTPTVTIGPTNTIGGTRNPGPTIPPPHVPLKGFVDLHTHPLANLGFGGKLFYGGPDIGSLLPADPDCHANVRASSEQQALGHDRSTHGGHDFLNNSCGDEIRKLVIHGLQSGLHGADVPEDASGFPNFPDWPVWNDLTHQKMWVEWIRRAYQGGLRVMVALAVNNKTLGDMTAGPGDYPTDDKTSTDLQIAEIKSFVARHPDFMEIALGSSDINRIVAGNRLAVVVGIEVDHIGNFETSARPGVPSDNDVKAEIDRLFGQGVRYIFPIHVLDNAFGGTAAYVNLFNVSNLRESGHRFALVCATVGEDIDYTYNSNDLDPLNVAGQLGKLGMATIAISYPPCPSGQRNSLGLSSSGVTALKEMMRLGMLIDIDHMSQTATDAALGLATSFNYPVNTGHNGPRGGTSATHTERALRSDQYAAIGRLHGMAGVGSGGLNSSEWLTLYNSVVQDMGGGSIAAGFGTDTDGFAPGMPPRLEQTVRGPEYLQYQQCLTACDCGSPADGNAYTQCVARCTSSCKKQFPRAFVKIPGSLVQYTNAFPASSDGGKTWNINTDGVAHYGMLWDFLQDVRALPGGAAVVDNSIMNGAEYFFQTWQKAEAQSAQIK